MAFYPHTAALPERFRLILASFLQQPGLAFAHVLPEERVQQAFDEQGVVFAQEEDTVYTPLLTLWAFLSQVLFKQEQRSCAAAVSRVIVLLVALGRPRCSDNTGAYCRARAKLSECVIRRLTYDVAEGCERAIPGDWLWHGRHVYLVDGTTVSMPDTPENQEVYPQQAAQQDGVGFPIARMVMLLSLATAMLSGLALGPYSGKETGETALFRELLDKLHANDIVLADRYYCSYFMICLLRELGVDVVTRLHQKRTADFRRGRRLDQGDHIVQWQRPSKPTWMDDATYERMPLSLTVREVEVRVHQPGFRVESLVVVTTLLNAKRYTRQDIAELYHRRWLAELDIRAIKCTLGMDVLRCQSPQMVHKEIWTCLLAYNLIRQTMLESALESGRSPRQLSFTIAMQKIAASWGSLLLLDEATFTLLIQVHQEDIAAHRVGHRPDRIEPRAIKRRPKPHRLLQTPRQEARDELLRNKA